jgi:peptidoglycan hydrolase CwlO-like protein
MDGGAALAKAEDRASKAEARVKELEAEVETLGNKVPNAQGTASNKKEEGTQEFSRAEYGYLTDEEFEDLKSGKLKV